MGLERLNPFWRIIFVIISTSAFVFINNLEVGISAFAFSLTLLFIGRRIVLKKLLIFILIMNTAYFIVGNILFSPDSNESVKFFIFNISYDGLFHGLIGALKKNSMTIVSFAWLSSIRNTYDIYIAFNKFKFLRKYLIALLNYLEIFYSDFLQLYQAIMIKGFNLQSYNLPKKVIQLGMILKAVLIGLFNQIGKFTYNFASHYNYSHNSGLLETKLVNVNINYSEVGETELVLKDVSFESTNGITLVAGMNNSGKTTFLKTLSGFIPKVEGYILNGKIKLCNKVLDSDLTVDQITENLRFASDSPRDFIFGLNVGQELMSQTKDIKLAKKIAKQLKIEKLWDRMPNTLSGGEQARLVIASIICSDVNFIIFDSFLSQLDFAGRIEFLDALKQLSKDKDITIMIADSSFDFLINSADRIIYLNKGEIVIDEITNGVLPDKINNLGLTFPSLTKFNSSHKSSILLEAHNLSLTIQKNQILRNISLVLNKGECVAILGKNGSGKSSLMKVISRVLKMDKGGILTKGLKIGYIFQDTQKQIIETTAIEEVSLQFKFNERDYSKEEAFVSKYFNLFNIKLDKETIEMSFSEIKTLEIISNIYLKDIVILDEPTNGLDTQNVIKVHALINDLLATGVTVLIVTHNFKFSTLASRFLLMENGELFDFKDDFDSLKHKMINE